MSTKIPKPEQNIPGRVSSEKLLEYFRKLAQSFPKGVIQERSGIRIDSMLLAINADGAIVGCRIDAEIFLIFPERVAPDAREFLMEFAKTFEKHDFFGEGREVKTPKPLKSQKHARGEASFSLRVMTGYRTRRQVSHQD